MRIAVIGAGPCGLACGQELDRLGHTDWLLFERNSHPGGNASSTVDPNGFTWDYGGHVVFSHFGEFDRLLDEVMGDDLLEHERSSFVHIDKRWVPYPFQNNLHRLAPEMAQECLEGLVAAQHAFVDDTNFGSWMQGVFGEGIANHFMRPYNRKVWATSPEEMSSSWIAERVSVPDLDRVKLNFELRQDDCGWGPNSTFRFPRHGGTGEIFRRLARRLGSKIRYESAVASVDPKRRVLTLASGVEESYDFLVSTMPIDSLVGAMRVCPDSVRNRARVLKHSSVIVVGVGVDQPLLDDRSWLYFADPDIPFYRVTNFAKYSPANVPDGDTSRYSSFMTETAFRPDRTGPPAGIEENVTKALVDVGLSRSDSRVASVHRIDVEYGYPVPTLDRDAALREIGLWLESQNIFSRGRFGTWRYEIGNMDHAVKMGIDIARRILEDRPEELVVR